MRQKTVIKWFISSDKIFFTAATNHWQTWAPMVRLLLSGWGWVDDSDDSDQWHEADRSLTDQDSASLGVLHAGGGQHLLHASMIPLLNERN